MYKYFIHYVKLLTVYASLRITTLIPCAPNSGPYNYGIALAFAHPRIIAHDHYLQENKFTQSTIPVHSHRAQALSWRLFPWGWAFNWKENWRNRQRSKRERHIPDDNNYSRTSFADSVTDTSLISMDYLQFPLPYLSEKDPYEYIVDNYSLQCLEMKTSESIPKHIRLQAQLDPDLDILDTKNCIAKKLSDIKSLQASSCLSMGANPELYPRKWIRKSQTALINTKNRTTKNLNESTLTVMQFNILAEGLSEGPNTMAPFDTKASSSDNIKNTYGGFTKVQNPDQCLAFKNRKWRLLETILSFPSTADSDKDKKLPTSFGPDLLCVEEIDRFYDFFQPALSRFGYQGIFQPKPKAPGVKLGWYSDGCAIFFKKNAFELISHEQREFRKGTQIYIVTTLRHLESRRKLVVGVTHLKAGQKDENELVREMQAHEFLEEVEKAAIHALAMENSHEKNADLQTETNISDIPILLLGDFNAEPSSILNKENGKNVPSNKLPCSLSSYSSSVSSLSGRSLKSAYPNDENDYTTWKTRGERSVKHVIDYILYSSVSTSKPTSDETFYCTKILNIPKEEDVEEGLYPGFRHPSDHINIAAQFSIQKQR